MSGSATKATNRDIRRAFGHEVLSTVDRQGVAIAAVDKRCDALKLVDEGLGNAIAAVGTKVGEERTHRLKLAEEQRSYVDAQDRDVRRELRAFTARGFFGRLKWLFLGR